MRLTTKQIEILTQLRKGNSDGSLLDLDQLVDCVYYETTKQSMQFSIRALIGHELVQKMPLELRRGANRVTYSLTEFGYKQLYHKIGHPAAGDTET